MLKDKPYEAPAMRALRDLPIKRKLLVIIMAVTAAALAISGFGILVADAFLYRESLTNDLNALASITADNSSAALLFDGKAEAKETLDALRPRTHVLSACLYLPDGTVFAGYQRPGSDAPCPSPSQQNRLRFSTGQIDVSHAVIVKGQRVGTLVMLYDLDELYTRMRLYGLYVLAILLASGLIAFFLSSWLRNVIAGPISQLAVITAAVSETKDYGIRAQARSRDELGVLVETFNNMLASVQSRDRELREALVSREEALGEAQRTRDFLRTTLASIGDAVISTDSAGCIVFANRVACALLRRPEEEIAGHLTTDTLHMIDEQTRAPVENPVQRVLRGASAEGLASMILVVADGSEVPIDESVAPILSPAGAVKGAVLVFRDTSERRRVERELRAAREQLQMITDTMAAAVARCDRDMRFVWVSRRYADRLGLSKEDIAGRTITEVLGADVYQQILPYMESALQGKRVDFEVKIDYERIGWRWIRATYVPTFDHTGAVDGWVADVADITEIKEAQAAVVRMNVDLQRSNVRLARSNEDLERFAFAASHDLQEPLRMVTTYTQLLERSRAGRLEDEERHFMRNIVDGALRMRGLLSDLLAYSEIGGEPEEPVRGVDLDRVLAAVLSNLQVAIDESGTTVETAPLPAVTGHSGHFVQLFQNLISNAIKYRSERPPRIRVWCEQLGGELRFAVADNGIGIAPEYHERIFGVFKRLHGKKIPGTGIGLAICHRVVERYGGRIWVESHLGKGATFWFTIPARKA